jgi:hypothetical protein
VIVGLKGDNKVDYQPSQALNVSRHEKQIRSQIRREGLVGLMNAPKWRRLADALDPFALQFRIKLVHEDEPEMWTNWIEAWSPSYIDSGIGPVRNLEIDWMEIALNEADQETCEPITIGALVEILESLRVPHEVDGDTVRVIGYQRPNRAVESPL